MVVNSVQQKSNIQQQSDTLNSQIKSSNLAIHMDMQVVTQQTNLIQQQSPLIEKSVQQQPMQMQLNQRALANQPIQTITQIEPMQQQSPVDNKIVQKIEQQQRLAPEVCENVSQFSSHLHEIHNFFYSSFRFDKQTHSLHLHRCKEFN